jgi:hypothetical protein
MGLKKNGTVIENSKEFLEVQVIKTNKYHSEVLVHMHKTAETYMYVQVFLRNVNIQNSYPLDENNA